MKVIQTGINKFTIGFEKDGKLITSKLLSNLNENDLFAITTVGRKPKSKPGESKKPCVINFKLTCEKFGEDPLNEKIKVDKYIENNLMVDHIEEYVPKTKEGIVEIMDSISISDIEYNGDVLAIACVVLAAQYRELKCPPLLLVVGPTGVNKTGTMRLFRDSRFVKWTGRATAKAWLPGRPNSEAERTRGIFERSDNRCIIQNEIASMRGEDNMDFILGIITDSYGPAGIVLDDGGGETIIPTYFTTIFGMTSSMYWEWIDKSLGYGQRFLSLSMYNDYETYHSSFNRKTSLEDDRKKWISLINKVKDNPLPKVSEEMFESAYNWSKRIMVLTSIRSSGTYYESNGGHRLADQLISMALMKALLEEKEPEVSDVEYFFDLTVKMVPYQKDWKNIIEYGSDHGYRFFDNMVYFKEKGNVFNNLFSLRIFKKEKDEWYIDDEWLDFLKKLGGMW